MPTVNEYLSKEDAPLSYMCPLASWRLLRVSACSGIEAGLRENRNLKVSSGCELEILTVTLVPCGALRAAPTLVGLPF